MKMLWALKVWFWFRAFPFSAHLNISTQICIYIECIYATYTFTDIYIYIVIVSEIEVYCCRCFSFHCNIHNIFISPHRRFAWKAFFPHFSPNLPFFLFWCEDKESFSRFEFIYAYIYMLQIYILENRNVSVLQDIYLFSVMLSIL